MSVTTLVLALLHVAASVDTGQLACKNQSFALSPDAVRINGTHFIGVLMGVANFNPNDGLCRESLSSHGILAVETVELLSHLISRVNDDASLLPKGVRLGLVAFDDYTTERFTVSQAIKFLSVCGGESHVISVFCCNSIARTKMVASLLSNYAVPHVNFNPLLSFRLENASSRFYSHFGGYKNDQIYLLPKLIRYFNWTYISLIYSTGSFGTEALELFESSIRNTSICIAYDSHYPGNMDRIATAIGKQNTTVVVLLIASTKDLKSLANAFLNSTRRYLWITPDDLDLFSMTDAEKDVFRGMLVIGKEQRADDSLKKVLRERMTNRAPGNGNPWLPSYLQTCACKWATGGSTCSDEINETCGEHEDLNSVNSSFWAVVDGFRSYLGNRSDDFNSTRFLKQLRDSPLNRAPPTGEGLSVNVMEKFNIRQLQWDEDKKRYALRLVGAWSAETGRELLINETLLQWPDSTLPRGACSEPCAENAAKIAGEVSCCWKCLECPAHQRPLVNGSCESCPYAYWPRGNQCVLIPYYCIQPSSGIGTAILFTVAVGLALVVAVAAVYVRYRSHPLIKATCRETSAIALVGIAMQFATAAILLIEPATQSCTLRRYFIHVSFAVVYGPTLVKCIKIFRIFWMGKRSAQQPRFIGVQTQILVSLAIIAFQVAVVSLTLVTNPVARIDKMPSEFEESLERLCKEDVSSVAIPFVVNILLLLSCCILAFKCRKLPDNFNESQQIAFGVLASVFSVCVFMSAFFLSARSDQRVLMLFLSVSIPGVVGLASLFAPKVVGILSGAGENTGGARTMTFMTKVGPTATH